MRIGIVGPCGAGKTTLARSLGLFGYDAHDIAQEHSGVPYMWQRITHPDILIYLDAALETVCSRLNVDWEQSYIDEQHRRLSHARSHAILFIDTNPLSRDEVLRRSLDFLRSEISPKA